MKRVYLVDDDPLHQNAIAALLSRWDLTVAGQAGDGATALAELCGGCDVDLIVTDCQMPRMDGLMLTRLVRQCLGATPVIMLSGQTATELAETARCAGVDAFLNKPLSSQCLAATIERLLQIRIAA